LRAAGIRYAIAGAYAVALHGAVRGTINVDVVLHWTRGTLARTEAALNGIGLVSRLPVSARNIFEFRDEYLKNRDLAAWNFYNPDDPSEQVDIVITYDLTAKQGKRIKGVKLPSGPVQVLSLKDLIGMKRTSRRPQDIEDVRALERL
jgi:hypothetical protein